MKSQDLIPGEQYALRRGRYNTARVLLLDNKPWRLSYGGQVVPTSKWQSSRTGAPYVASWKGELDVEAALAAWSEYAAQFKDGTRYKPTQELTDLRVGVARLNEIHSTWAVAEVQNAKAAVLAEAAAAERERRRNSRDEWIEKYTPVCQNLMNAGYNAYVDSHYNAADGTILVRLTGEQAIELLHMVEVTTS